MGTTAKITIKRPMLTAMWRDLARKHAALTRTGAAAAKDAQFGTKSGEFTGALRMFALLICPRDDAPTMTLAISILFDALETGESESKIITELFERYGD